MTVLTVAIRRASLTRITDEARRTGRTVRILPMPVLGAGADGAAGAVFRDTPENRVLFECERILRYTNCFNFLSLEYDIEVETFPAQYHLKQIVYKKFEACVFS